MSTAIEAANGRIPRGEAIENALIRNDVAALSARERMEFYLMRCEAAGLDPRSQPFQYILLPGKVGQPSRLALYATKAATDQLISRRRISLKILSRGFDKATGLYETVALATFPDGQAVEDVGAVWIGEDVAGEYCANQVMKCVTKAKRRTVLSACGLGMLDETEVDTIPGAVRVDPEEMADAPDASGPPARAGRPWSREPYPGAVKPETALQPAPSNEPATDEAGSTDASVSDLRGFVRAELRRADGELREALATAGKLRRGMQPAICNEHRLVNKLLSQWIAEGLVQRSEIETPDGTRNRARAADVLLGMYREMRTDVEADIRDLVVHYRDLAFRAHGLEPPAAAPDTPPAPGDRDEAQATADDPGSDE